jgi:hypothetical protein
MGTDSSACLKLAALMQNGFRKPRGSSETPAGYPNGAADVRCIRAIGRIE